MLDDIKRFIEVAVQNFLNENYSNIYYHGTGEKQKVIKALKDNTFIFNKSGGVENGIYITPNKELAMKYSDIATGNDKGVVEVILIKDPKIMVYKNQGEYYDDEMSYNLHNTKDAILKHREDMLSKGYDGIQASDDVIMIFKEKINIVKPVNFLNENKNDNNDNFNLLNKFFNNKIGKLLDWGKHSFVFEYDSDKVIKIKNNNNEEYNDYGFYKTFKIGTIKLNKDVLRLNNKYLTIYHNKLYYVIMERLETPKELYNRIDDVEFSIKDFLKDKDIISLLWLYNNLDNDNILVELINHAKNNIFDNTTYNSFLNTLSELLPLLIKMKKNNIDWRDIHKGNFGYNKNGNLVPFDMEY